MLTELKPGAIRPLTRIFDTPHMRYIIHALDAGNCRGRVWVDDPSDPGAALLWDEGAQCYLAGDRGDERFIEDARQVIAGEVSLTIEPCLIVHYPSDRWIDDAERIFAPRRFHKARRRLYTLQSTEAPQAGDLPSGYTIARIDRHLLGADDLEGIGSLRDEIGLMWPSIDRFLSSSFGFCALWESREIACWCTGEYAQGSHIGIGIETAEPHRRRGVATATASAFVRHCAANGIEAHWDCWAANTASRLTAERVGFGAPIEYDTLWGETP